MDSEKQKDEISALESICNTEEFMYEEVNGKYECILKIFIRLPEDYCLMYKNTRAADEVPTKVSISHLPPLTLYASLPLDYPSKSAPKFTLCCCWLRHWMLSKLCLKLDKLWQDNKEQEIIYTWMTYLQNETLEYLNIQSYLDISHIYTLYLCNLEKAGQEALHQRDGQCRSFDDEKKTFLVTKDQASSLLNKKKAQNECKPNCRECIDQRAIVDALINQNPVQMLVDHNEKQSHIAFKKNFYMCNICFNEKSGEQCTQFTPCSHVFCKECINGYLVTRINDGTVQNISCPENRCTSEATPGQVKELVSSDLFAKYDSILLSVTLESLNDIVYCPRKRCQYPVSRELNEVMASCPICHYTFCIHCKMVYHGIEPCKINTDDKRKLIAEYKEASNERKMEMELHYGKKQLQSLLEETLSENWIANNTHHCPHCNATIEKSDGCNKMTCYRCNTYFCWICGAHLNREMPYLHYRDPNSKCFNMLYHGLIPAEDHHLPPDHHPFFGFNDLYDEQYEYYQDGHVDYYHVIQQQIVPEFHHPENDVDDIDAFLVHDMVQPN